MKKVLSILLIAILAISCLPLAGCGEIPGMTVVTLKDFRADKDGKFTKLLEKVDHFDGLEEDDYVCVLDEQFTDETVIPSEQGGKPVVYLTADTSFNKAGVTKLDVPDSVKTIEYIYPNNNSSLKSLSLPEGVTVVNSFCKCSELEDVDLSKPAEKIDSFVSCAKLMSDVFEKSENAGICTLVLEKDVTYKFDNIMKFNYEDLKDAEEDAGLDTPKGKWLQVDIKVLGDDASLKNQDDFVKGENILLNGAAASSYDTIIPAGTTVSLIDGGLSPSSYVMRIFYDVPKEFDMTTAEVTCHSDVEIVE